VTIREQALGTGDPNVARTLNNMAILYEGRGESGSALAHSRKATAAVLIHRTAESMGSPETGADRVSTDALRAKTWAGTACQSPPVAVGALAKL
jgi:hypothetical protein